MKIEVINTGSEILMGFVTNTHLGFMARELAPLGLRIDWQVCVPDGPPIAEAFDLALRRSRIILLTGGLGPTSDDMTRDVVAASLHRNLRRDEWLAGQLREFFATRNLCLTENNLVQAMVPEGARVLDNPHGTAPGLYLEDGGRHIFLLPGPPRELKPMFVEKVLPILRDELQLARPVSCHILRTTGLGESALARRIEPLVGHIRGLEIGYCARIQEVDLRFVGPDPGCVAEAAQIARQEFGRHVFTETNQSLEEVVIALLAAAQKSVSTAESCTGGLIANRLTHVPGSSGVFHGGIVAYANEVKTKLLGVRPETLQTQGAVSEATAREMAEGVRQILATDYALAATGIAGPDGGTEAKPVGLAYIALAATAGTQVIECRHATDRQTFKQATSQSALDLLRRALLP
ncbi:MAG: competence/damage-inducible protein A [Verrucomicrobiae bacterium]|nr:competence/damage-inducible protein A [Verrucomicrobiae bacterium]